ncbi:hypothetical protein EVAR_54991_1 [Eumeta japonica]|uniref:Uncharacterized protein n=1 Tax=Eumeta variegata TaxID=151549 RepID=A0A4C1Z0Y3_EUMVA|nr:hypothetical protein EVAR_54991_1 [Eumeta japonica]
MRSKRVSEPSESRWSPPLMDTSNPRGVAALLGENSVSNGGDLVEAKDGGGIGHRSSHSVYETLQRKLLLHVRILKALYYTYTRCGSCIHISLSYREAITFNKRVVPMSHYRRTELIKGPGGASGGLYFGRYIFFGGRGGYVRSGEIEPGHDKSVLKGALPRPKIWKQTKSLFETSQGSKTPSPLVGALTAHGGRSPHFVSLPETYHPSVLAGLRCHSSTLLYLWDLHLGFHDSHVANSFKASVMFSAGAGAAARERVVIITHAQLGTRKTGVCDMK